MKTKVEQVSAAIEAMTRLRDRLQKHFGSRLNLIVQEGVNDPLLAIAEEEDIPSGIFRRIFRLSPVKRNNILFYADSTFWGDQSVGERKVHVNLRSVEWADDIIRKEMLAYLKEVEGTEMVTS